MSETLSRKEIMEVRLMPPRQTSLAALLAIALALPVFGQRAELQRRIQRQVLPNGLEVIVVENRGVPLVTIEVDVRNGSFTQGPQFEGLSHHYEHLFYNAKPVDPQSIQLQCTRLE